MTLRAYHLGLPMWAHKAWVGELFASDARSADFMGQYSSVFNAVEGNTTFYGLPSAETVDRWRDESAPGFRFTFKVPRTVTHEARLSGGLTHAKNFLELMTRLGDRCGPLFVQLPPSFGPTDLGALDTFLHRVPETFRCAVEVRHPAFFDRGRGEMGLDRLLERHDADRVIMDTRVLMRADGSDPYMAEMQRRKPRLPVRKTALGQHPFVRIINANDLEQSEPLLAAWADVTADWIAQGRTPFVFLHSADDFYAPRMAHRFHELLSERAEVGELPTFPAKAEAKQLSLLG